jgi:dGTPase
MSKPAWAASPFARMKETSRQQERWRSAAQVDIDRVLYSPEFRRLGGVTQVVPPQVDYQFHDRLSHSVKVAQVAAALARQLVHQARHPADSVFPHEIAAAHGIPHDVLADLDQWVDPEHCYVAGLAHDLGHPPFGHAGEIALQKFCDDMELELPAATGAPADAEPEEDFDALSERSFEGNAQSTRIVATLSFRRDEVGDEHDEPGLNLTYRSLAAIAKYPWLKGGHPYEIGKLRKKWSFYPEERAILDELVARAYVLPVSDASGRIERVYRWVESEIMDWADDISYAVHDLEDFFRAGLIPLHQVALALQAAPRKVKWGYTDFDFVENEELELVLIRIHARLLAIAGKQFEPDETAARELVARAFSKIHRDLKDEMPTAPFTGSRSSHARLRSFGATLIRYLTGSARLVYDPTTERVQLEVTPEAILVAEFYKALNKLFVIESAMLSTAQYGQSADIDVLCVSLFQIAVEAMAESEDPRGNRRLPPRLREYLRRPIGDDADLNGDGRDDYYVSIMTRVIDYVCGLSDFQASKLAQLLTGSSDLSVLGGRWLDT